MSTSLSEPSVLPLDCPDIPKSIRLKAEHELGETDVVREKCVEELKKLIEDEPNLKSNTSDNFLLQFLRARKYETLEAFGLLKRYYRHRKDYAYLYKNYTPRLHQKVMESEIMNFLPARNADGCAIWAVQFGRWEPEISCFDDILRFGLLCNEQVLKNPVTQICGVVSIVDFKGLSWSHLFHIPSTAIRCYVNATQDSLPIRHKAIHIINSPSIFAFLFAVIKPLINQKLKNRIHFHGNDWKSLHQFLPADILPHEFGGSQGNFHNEQFYSSLLACDEEFQECSKFGYEC